ncbi:SPRY domain-containing protein [Bacillus chungangensis]|uniref:B30.2/SPRY domain-containing protein n=1 Tax=Bacillus chungangensis TaxID=587633 RepID=A0ABT9WWY7_9BACI|nr:hypothetical protein [Bacillus chungangensis]MDQ0177732.1 hypothetical protein [Bacillus chungangensis]
MARLGQVLAVPESGWKRTEPNVSNIKTVGGGSGWKSNSGYDYGTSNPTEAKFIFQVAGTDTVRLMTFPHANRTNINIRFNRGLWELIDNNSINGNPNTFKYEKTGLDINETYLVELEPIESKGWFAIDAIDIKTNGRFLHPDEVTDPKDLAIGKRIRCHYQTVSGQVGVFSNLGKETSDFIPSESSAIPNGDFYFICVDRDQLGRWKLIADRNIQHSISWDVLNSAGIASGSGVLDKNIRLTYSFSTGKMSGKGISISENSTRIKTSNSSVGGLTANPIYYNTGKLYFEIEYLAGNTSAVSFGLTTSNFNVDRVMNSQPSSAYLSAYQYFYDGQYSHLKKGNIVGISVDTRNGKMRIDVNGQLKKSIDIGNKIKTEPLYPFFSTWTSNSMEFRFNFGEKPFVYMDTLEEGYIPCNEAYYELMENGDTSFRLLTGGINTSDKDNEWDKYIVKSDLEGRVTPGDNNVWNWNNNSPSWTSTTQTNALRRVRRGGAGEGVGAYYGDRAVFSETSRTGDSSGFRPVLLIENLLVAAIISDRDSYLISRDGRVGMNLIIKPTMDDFKWMLTARIDQKVFYISEEYEGEQALIVKIPPHLFKSIEEKEVTIEFWVNEKIRNTLVVKAKIANQTPTIEMGLNEYTLKIDIVDADGDPFYYEIKLNKKELLSSGSVVGATRLTKYLNSSNLLIGQQNEIEVRVVDHYGGKDSRVLTFEGKYHGLMFSDERGEFYSNDLGEILKKLMISGVYAGEDSDIFTIKLINTHNYPIKDLKLLIDYYEPTNGTDISISKSNDPYKGDDVLAYSEEIASEDAVTFYLQLHTLEGSVGTGKFKVRATARRAS